MPTTNIASYGTAPEHGTDEMTMEDVANLHRLQEEQLAEAHTKEAKQVQERLRAVFDGPQGDFYHDHPHELTGFGD